MRRVLVPLAAGFEEIETATLVDVLRRAGVEVVLAGLDGPEPVSGSRGVRFVPDCALDLDDTDYDLVALPGGVAGAEAMAAHAGLKQLLADRVRKALPVAAICAAPLVLDQAGVLSEGQFTCYPGLEEQMTTVGRRRDLVVDRRGVITSQGPGTALAFALHLVETLEGRDTRNAVANGLLYQD